MFGCVDCSGALIRVTCSVCDVVYDMRWCFGCVAVVVVDVGLVVLVSVLSVFVSVCV